ncbi:MAG TPA: thioredoxin family protein [Chloroflexia bacterium]|nr:thioredoxin family protein [Chloroflexia bacterium]
MLNIKILGPGCANCKKLEALVRKVVAENKLEVEVEKITDFKEIMQWPILHTPGLVVNGKLVVSGRVPGEVEIAGFLK